MNTLTPKQRQAAQFIAAGHTHRQAAAAVKVTPQTVSEWAGRRDFRAYVDSLLSAAEQETAQALTGLRLRAVEKLGELLEHQSPGIALRAIDAALSLTATRIAPPAPSAAPEWNAIIARITAYEAEEPTRPH
ncbi:hypothetical protein [Arenimonas sp. SCN 70-307]|uniref:hypothetical protein n=1 Tax=Arenimonas sp. SCN 70-307 TaxID=1660089 RepID=UPI0025C0F3F7|nr:hypothetical protein [Arenimonas sp. SCN 70-307]